MPKKFTGPILGLAAILIVGAGTWYYFQNAARDDVMQAGPPSAPSTSSGIDIRTYTDTRVGYAFDYPGAWQLSTTTYTEAGGEERQIRLAEVVPPGAEPLNAAFSVEQDYRTLEQARQSGTNELPMTISGQAAYRYENASEEFPSDFFIIIPSRGVTIIAHNPDAEMSRILDSFRLISP